MALELPESRDYSPEVARAVAAFNRRQRRAGSDVGGRELTQTEIDSVLGKFGGQITQQSAEALNFAFQDIGMRLPIGTLGSQGGQATREQLVKSPLATGSGMTPEQLERFKATGETPPATGFAGQQPVPGTPPQAPQGAGAGVSGQGGQYNHPAIKSRDLIIAGQDILVPLGGGQPIRYTIKSGDTLSGLATKYDTTIDKILSANNLSPTGAPVAPTVPPPSAPIVPESKSGITESVDREALAKAEAQKKYQENIENLTKESSTLGLQKQIADLKTGLGITPPKPDYLADEDVKTLEDTQTKINDLDAQVGELEASLRQGLAQEEGRLAPMEIIGQRQLTLQRQAQEQIDFLERKKDRFVNQYNTKLNSINLLMKEKQMNWEDAKWEYQTKFDNAYKMQTLMATTKNQERDNAAATLNTMTNLFKERNLNWDELPAMAKTQFKQLELEADYPEGAIEAYFNSAPKMDIKWTSTQNGIMSFFGIDENGEPKLIKALPVPGYTGDVVDGDKITSDIENYALNLNAGQIKIANVPQLIRGQVLTKAKDFAVEDLREDIITGISQNAFKDKNDAISQLRNVYPEFTKEEIEKEVNSLFESTTTPTKEPQGGLLGGAIKAVGGFFRRLFGK